MFVCCSLQKTNSKKSDTKEGRRRGFVSGRAASRRRFASCTPVHNQPDSVSFGTSFSPTPRGMNPAPVRVKLSGRRHTSVYMSGRGRAHARNLRYASQQWKPRPGSRIFRCCAAGVSAVATQDERQLGVGYNVLVTPDARTRYGLRATHGHRRQLYTHTRGHVQLAHVPGVCQPSAVQQRLVALTSTRCLPAIQRTIR